MHILSDLDLYLLKTNSPPLADVERVERAFQFWQTSWTETFKALKVMPGNPLHSDDFLGRDAIALFKYKEPIALFFSHWVHLRPSQTSHSYFKNYPSGIIQEIQRMGFKRCMILSYMTVHPDYRKSNTDVPMYELLFSLGVKLFETVPHECLIGYIRKDLSFHSSFERHGGQKIGENQVYNVGVDYLYMTKHSLKLSPEPGVARTAELLWEKMQFRNQTVRRQAA